MNELELVVKEKEDRLKIQEEVRKKYSDVDFPRVYLDPVFVGRRQQYKVPDRVAIVGETKEGKQVYGFASEDYNLIPHELLIHNVTTVLKSLKEYGKPKIKPTLISVRGMEGARMKLEVTFPEITHTVKERPINPKLTVRNSYDLGWEFAIDFGAVDQVCTNGMVAFIIQKALRRKHRIRFVSDPQKGLLSLNVEDMMAEISEGMKGYSEQIGLWKEWSETRLSLPQFEGVWEELPFGGRYTEEIRNMPIKGEQGTLNDHARENSVDLFLVYSAVTQFITHNVESEVAKLDYGVKAASVLTSLIVH